MAIPQITVNSREDLRYVLKKGDHRISSIIVNSILKNLKNKKKSFKIMEIKIIDELSIYDIKMNRENMLHSLNLNLKIYEKNEDYEMCSKILEAIQYLKINNQK